MSDDDDDTTNKKGFVAGLKSRLLGAKDDAETDPLDEKEEGPGMMTTAVGMLSKLGKLAKGDDLGDEDDEDKYVRAAEMELEEGEAPEARKWTDAEFELKKHDLENWRDFQKPRDWWLSAEEALPILQAEREMVREDASSKPNFVTAGLLAANRFITEQVKALTEQNTKEPPKFRDGIEAIVHVLPPDTQRVLHSKVCRAARDGDIEVLKSLLRFEIDLDTSDQFGTPLHYAASFGRLEVLDRVAITASDFPYICWLHHFFK